MDVAGVTRTYTYTQYGLPASRSIGPGRTENYVFDVQTGNLTSRSITDAGQAAVSESFTYDAIGRLEGALSPTGTGGSATYDGYSNATQIAGAAAMQYTDAQHPYTLTSYTAVDTTLQRDLTVEYNVSGKPARIRDSIRTVSISYGCNGERVAMLMTDALHDSNIRRQYFGGCLEVKRVLVRPGIWGDVPTLYIGGDYYSAPVAITGDGISDGTTVKTIWRDYLGSIREVYNETDGSSESAAAYDAWGRTCDAEDRELVSASTAPTSLGRGFGGHEYLPWFGLYNANARLYDPLLGRFLSPDPYVQAPDFSVNFNRYAWCLNNPLKYTDENGEWIHILIGAIIGGVANVASNWKQIEKHGFWTGVGYFMIGNGIGAASAATGGWLAGVTQAAGVGAGAIIGASTGALTGAASSGATTVLNNWMTGNTWDSGLDRSLLSGAITGAITGAISGGVQGYKYAKEHGANPWNREIDGSEVKYETAVKEGVPIQEDPTEYCYANSAAYADAGHGNHSVEFFKKAGEYRKGWDVSVLKEAAASFENGGTMGDLSKDFEQVGVLLQDSHYEMMGTIPSEAGRQHWVNIFKIRAVSKLSMFGGGSSVAYTIGFWNPASGLTQTTSSISYFKVYKF